VVCSKGKVLAEIVLPIGGWISREPMEVLAEKLKAIQNAAVYLGFAYPDLRTTLAVMTTPAIAFIRICEAGLFSIDKNSFMNLIVE
jgi:adenine deaminase